MDYKEEYRDLFSLPNNYVLAHCVSRDLAMGAGIAKVFRDKYGIKRVLTSKEHNSGDIVVGCGECVFVATTYSPWVVANLITKEHYWEKPTYKSLSVALDGLRHGAEQMLMKNNYVKIGMPLIGCGLDKLSWDKVSAIIKDKFADLSCEILVCRI